jgi:CAAX protease family protein
MAARRVFVLALLTQTLLIVVASIVSRVLNLPPRWGQPVRDILIGLAGAGILALANYLLLVHGPANWVVVGVRAVYHQVLVPLFSRFDIASIIVVGTLAGIGEEWLFRGILQPLFGWIVASVLFGLAHVGGRNMVPFGVWASGMGLVLGGLAYLTGGLTAPIVAHAVYDMLALAYIRRGAHNA